MALTNKWVVWIDAWRAEYVLADGVSEKDNTVSFLQGEIVVREYRKSEILKYYEVKE